MAQDFILQPEAFLDNRCAQETSSDEYLLLIPYDRVIINLVQCDSMNENHVDATWYENFVPKRRPFQPCPRCTATKQQQR